MKKIVSLTFVYMLLFLILTSWFVTNCNAIVFSPEYDGCGNDDGGEASGFAVIEHWSSSNKYFGSGTAHAVSRSGPVTLYDEGSAYAYFFLSNSWVMSEPSGLYNIRYVARLDGFMETYMTSEGVPFDPWDPPIPSYASYEATLKLILIVIDVTEFEQVLYEEFVIFDDSASWWYELVPFIPMGERMDFNPTIPYMEDYDLYLEHGHEYLWAFWLDVRTYVENFLIGGVIAAGDLAGQLDYVKVESVSIYDLEVSANAPESVYYQDEFSVMADVYNVGEGDTHNVIAMLYLSDGLSLISGDNPQNLGTIPSGGSASASWDVRGDSEGYQALTVDASCDEGARDIDSEFVQVVHMPEYYIEVIAGVTDKPIIVGEKFDVIAEVENEGTADLHNVIATLDLPPGLALVSGDNPQSLDTIPAYDSAWANWEVRADSKGKHTVSVEATCDEEATDVDYETANVVGPPPISIEIVSSDRAIEDLRFPLLAYVTNEGDIWAYDCCATLTLPPGLELVGGDPNPECEEKLGPGEIWTLRWYLKGVPGHYSVRIDVECETGCHVFAIQEIDVDPVPSDVYLFWNYTVENDIRCVATGDIDGDGICDVAFGSRGNVYAIKSDRTLLWNYTTGCDSIFSLDIGDLDGDQKGEVVAGCSDGYVYAVDSPPDGQIGVLMWPPKKAYTHDCCPYIYDIETGDLDGDLKDDIVSGAANGYGDVFAFSGFDGDLLWSKAFDWSFLPVSDKGDSLGLGDIDGDGINDVAVAIADFTTPRTTIFALRGYDGLNLWGPPDYGYPTEKGIWAVDVGDVCGDSKAEVVAGGEEWIVYALRHTSTGSPPSECWTRELPSAKIYSIRVGDLDGDGDNDVAVGTSKFNGDNVVGLYGHNGDFIWSLPLEIYVRDIDIGDFDGDGINDVAAGGNYGGKAKIWVVNATGRPIGNYTLEDEISWQSLEMGDISGDGNSDVAVGSYDDYLYILTCFPPDIEGPTTSFSFVYPNPTKTNPTANATIVDSLSSIVAAEYFVISPGADGTGVPMNPVDGSFDSKSEIVTAIIDISGFSDENHTIYVHGKDNAGNWGDFNTASFTIDRIPPIIRIVSPHNITYTKIVIDLNVTANELIDTWMFSLNGASNFTFTPNATIPSNRGSNNLSVYANDTAGNLGWQQVSWFVKRITTLKLSLSSSAIDKGASVTIICSISAPVNDGTSTIQFSEDQTTWFNISSGTPIVGVYAANWTPPTSGLFYIRGTWSGDIDYEGSISAPQELTVAFGVGIVDARILNAPANTVYFIYADPTYMTRAEATYDVASGENVRGLCTNTQHYGFNTTEHWLLPSGAINTTTIHNATIAMFGSRFPNVAVEYYENVANLAPVLFKVNSTHLWYENRIGANLGILPWSIIKAPNYHEDMFTVMVFEEGDNTFFFVYGMDWKGTWAGGIYFKEVMSKSLGDYSNVYYVFHWVDDAGQDGIPQSSEIHLQSSG